MIRQGIVLFSLILFWLMSPLWAANVKPQIDRVTVPVTVTVANQYWVETISICNTSGSAIPLTDIELNFNYAVPMPSSIWGQPWAAWRVASQQNGRVILLGGSGFTLMPDPNCRSPLTVQFNASPDTPAPTGPFVFKAAGWQGPTTQTGNLTVVMPSAPAAGVSTAQVTVAGMGKTFQQAVNWGTQWPLTNLAVGSYQVTATNVSNGTTTYQAAPVNINVTAQQTVVANVQYTQTPPVPTGNINHGAWIYDMRYNNDGSRAGTQPGLFATEINSYNTQAGPGHKLTHLFTYGGDVEMYCQGSGGSSSSTACTADKLIVTYVQQSTVAYYNATKDTANPVELHPIVDGVVGGEYLKTFNTLTRAQANIFADNVAKLYCADNLVSGVQFDIEPFDINQPGQAYFYAQIAKNFAGQHDGPGQPDPYGCVNASHPKGRTFSVFTFSGRVNAALGTILNQYNNGYVVGSLYDLSSNPGGVITPVNTYITAVNNEVSRMMANAQANNIKYQFGIPAQASVHEFESVNGQSTGYAQLDYVKAAINAINTKGVRNDPLFRGINLWGFNHRMFWGGKEFTPSKPNTATRNYLATSL